MAGMWNVLALCLGSNCLCQIALCVLWYMCPFPFVQLVVQAEKKFFVSLEEDRITLAEEIILTGKRTLNNDISILLYEEGRKASQGK